MSVINQMLKDLDDRNPEQAHSASQTYIPKQVKSPIKAILITVLIMLCVTAAALFIWNVYQENQQLKLELNNNTNGVVVKPVIDKVTETEKASVQTLNVHQPVIPATSEKDNLAVLEKTLVTNTDNIVEIKNNNEVEAVLAANTSTHESHHLNALGHEHGSHTHLHNGDNKAAFKTSHNDTEQVIISPVAAKEFVEQEKLPKIADSKKVSSISISRKRLSPKELVAKKMNKAERAIAENEMEKAESIFEDILLLMPENQTARKQLAALWYGRKSYQPALNLLQQGIALTPNYQEFRLMKARIYLTLGMAEKAYDVLSVLNKSNDIEYQSLLANAAQQIGNYTAAVNAYLNLVQLSPQNGRFWLGLAIAYDSNSEFSQAIQAYESAIVQGGLSTGATEFAKQRMEELGE